MESSSENSFAWTDTSSDSLSNTSVSANINNKSNDNFIVKKYKDKNTKNKSLSKTVLNDVVDIESKVMIKEEQTHFENNINSSIKKKIIKIEPDSDNDMLKKKKKIKHIETNGNINNSLDSGSYDETYLDMKVKQEESLTCLKSNRKKRKHESCALIESTTKMNSKENYSNSEIIDEVVKQEVRHETEITKPKKKKKKSKMLTDNDDHNLEIEDKVEIDDTIINEHKQTLTDCSPANNKSLQEESDDSGHDDISAIKCDDSHNIHTISFADKNIEQNTKINSNKNEISSDNSESEIDTNKKIKETKHRIQRISDRIRFEDDDDTNIESSPPENDITTRRKSSKLYQYVRANPNLKQLSQAFQSNATLTQDEEIWILKCSQDINIQDFTNTNVNTSGKWKLKICGQTYDCSTEEQSDTISLLTTEGNNFKIKSFPLNGIINLRKRIPKAHFRDDNIMVNNQTNFIPLPETKCRHPLFGSNYKKALKIPAAIVERLNVQDNEDCLMTVEKRKKKNKRNKKSSEQADSQAQSVIFMKSEPKPSLELGEKKKKKRKLIAEEGPPSKKVKRLKHDPESAEAWESEKAIEENLFNF